jgi:hypothetical protein
MTRFRVRFLAVSISTVSFSILLIGIAEAQERTPGSIGLSAVLQSNQVDIMVPIWVSHSVVLAPICGFTLVSGSSNDLTLGLESRLSLSQSKMMPYLGARFAVATLGVEEGSRVWDVILGPVLGGEYFFNDHFSVAVEAQLNVALSARGSYRFGNPGGTNINTATAAVATVYF